MKPVKQGGTADNVGLFVLDKRFSAVRGVFCFPFEIPLTAASEEFFRHKEAESHEMFT